MHAGWPMAFLTWLLAGFLLVMAAPPAHAEQPEFADLEITHTDEGVVLGFTVKYDLPRGVEEALQKGVPLYFVAEAEVFRDRWYWVDKRVGRATRIWRVAFQPLTRKYRVTFGGLNQNFDNLTDALSAVRRVSGWKIAEAGDIDPGSRHYVELKYRLDTTLLPRPMQIGIGGQPEWTLLVEKSQRFN